MKEGQCWDCYSNKMFEYHGLTPGFSFQELSDKYASGLYEGKVILCYTCGDKMKYTKTEEGKWVGEYIP